MNKVKYNSVVFGLLVSLASVSAFANDAQEKVLGPVVAVERTMTVDVSKCSLKLAENGSDYDCDVKLFTENGTELVSSNSIKLATNKGCYVSIESNSFGYTIRVGSSESHTLQGAEECLKLDTANGEKHVLKAVVHMARAK
jgi:hypothetical protein